jgi:beta-glucuronidase
MMRLRIYSLVAGIVWWFNASTTLGQGIVRETPLHGEWSFALDPVDIGEKHKWFAADFKPSRWDKVTVPHCYTIDKRYHYYTGTAWYNKKISKVDVPEGYRAFIRFEAVFYKAHLWLNGNSVGEHEGGYTPFEFDITELLANENIFALRVNNAWDTTTIPGAKTRPDPESTSTGQLFPWINYGGINRVVKLIIRPAAYQQNVRIVATPDLVKKTASVKLDIYLHNAASKNIAKGEVKVNIYQEGKRIPAKFKVAGQDVAGGAKGVITLDGTLAAKDVKLWNQDEPNIYQAESIVGNDTVRTTFGIRKIEIKGTSLLLNGEPIRMGGCNRPLDFPGHGSMDPEAVLEKDLTLIKNGSMELSRISHYPVSPALLDWADRHGLLIIGEAGNWQMTPQQMSDPTMRKKFQAQMREMVERDWNHPSVIAWSVGNEYPSNTDAGKAWTKDMYAYTKSIDPTRLVTFASMFVFRDIIKKPEDEASQYVDFVSANIYGGHLKLLQHVHELYPDKPIYISEFGLRTDGVKSEEERVEHLKKAVEDFRKCDYLIGASVWTFNDYESSFPGTNANGYRPWGLVSPERELRGMYLTWQEEFSPAVVTASRKGNNITVQVTARKDFPSYTLRKYKLIVSGKEYGIDILKPGEQKSFDIPVSSANEDVMLELQKPGGFVIFKKSVNP